MTIAKISSKVPAATNINGIPLFLPYPSSTKDINEGTITDGETQASKYPRV